METGLLRSQVREPAGRMMVLVRVSNPLSVLGIAMERPFAVLADKLGRDGRAVGGALMRLVVMSLAGSMCRAYGARDGWSHPVPSPDGLG